MTDARTHRAQRIALYADWLDHDADGLTFNLAYPAGQPIDGATSILARAREKLALALSRIDRSIEVDRHGALPDTPATLAGARARVADALSRIDQLIADTTDRSPHVQR